MLRDSVRLTEVAPHVPARDGRLAAWWARFEEMIEHHHEREDELVFPIVADLAPSFAAGELMADHAVLDVHLAQVKGTVGELTVGEDRHLRSDLTRQVRLLHHHLADHLRREESVVFPVLATGISPEAYQELETRMRKGETLSGLAFTIPWLRDEVDPEVEAVLLPQLPLPLRLLDRFVWERSYRRLAAPVRGDA